MGHAQPPSSGGLKGWLQGFVDRLRQTPADVDVDTCATQFHDDVVKELATHDPRLSGRLQQLLDDLEGGRLQPPMLPQVALELLQKARGNASFDDIAKLAVSDPSVAARIMKLASSPGLGGRIPPKGVKDALLRLGMFGIREVAFDIAFSSKTLRKGAHTDIAERTIRHARCTSALARLLARDVKVHPGVAALTGLVHALGGLVLVDELGHKKSASKVEMPGFLLYLCIQRLHPKVCALSAEAYKLDDDVLDALRGHHHLHDDSTDLARLLWFADAISPGEPGARVQPLAPALQRSGLVVDEDQVRDRLLPLVSMFAELKHSMEAGG